MIPCKIHSLVRSSRSFQPRWISNKDKPRTINSHFTSSSNRPFGIHWHSFRKLGFSQCFSSRFYAKNPQNPEESPSSQGFFGTEEFTRRTHPETQAPTRETSPILPNELSRTPLSPEPESNPSSQDLDAFDLFGGAGAVVTGYSATGFVVNDQFTLGAILMFPERFWSWNVSSMDDITIEKLAPIWLHNPAPQILVLGTGLVLERPRPEVVQFLLVRGITVEPAPTHTALATFNFLVQEGRLVAGAFLVPGYASNPEVAAEIQAQSRRRSIPSRQRRPDSL